MSVTLKPVVNISEVDFRESSHGDKFAAKLGTGRPDDRLRRAWLHGDHRAARQGRLSVSCPSLRRRDVRGAGRHRRIPHRRRALPGEVRRRSRGARRGPRDRAPDHQYRRRRSSVSRLLQQGRSRRGRVSGFRKIRGHLAPRLGGRHRRRALCWPARILSRLLGRRISVRSSTRDVRRHQIQWHCSKSKTSTPRSATRRSSAASS